SAENSQSCHSVTPPRIAEEGREQSPEDDIPGVDLSHLSPSEREQIRAVMRMAQMDDPGRREASQRAQYDKIDTTTKPDAPTAEKKPRQTSMTSSSEVCSPTRESGYGTTSTSYDRELGDFATKLEDAGEVAEKEPTSENEFSSETVQEDFDFTYSDNRFSALTDESFDTDRYRVSLHDDSSMNVDAVEMDEDDLYNSRDPTGPQGDHECGRRSSKVMSPSNRLTTFSFGNHPQILFKSKATIPGQAQ
ncbi:hypothetical protein COOONC_08786, partial [Cooperia oncophora]